MNPERLMKGIFDESDKTPKMQIRWFIEDKKDLAEMNIMTE